MGEEFSLMPEEDGAAVLEENMKLKAQIKLVDHRCEALSAYCREHVEEMSSTIAGILPTSKVKKVIDSLISRFSDCINTVFGKECFSSLGLSPCTVHIHDAKVSSRLTTWVGLWLILIWSLMFFVGGQELLTLL